MWAPTDGNAITRLLAALLRRRASGDRPSSLRLVAPFPLRAGVTTAENVMDLWWSPLLGEKWAAIIKGYSFTPFPFELVLPGYNGPRHDRMGLAIFQIAFEGPRSIPQVLDFQAPLLKLDDMFHMTIDVLTEHLTAFYDVMQKPVLRDIVCRPPKRSQASTKEIPRVTVDLIFPVGQAPLTQFLQLRHLRRTDFPAHTFFGSTGMFSDADAMILEFNSPSSLHHYWPLCSQLIVISSTRALVYSEATSEVWVQTLDRHITEDPMTAATMLKWKPSRHGGRPVATPSATAGALASSSKQRASQRLNNFDYITDVRLRGEVGREDAEVLRSIMTHACSATGIILQEARPDGPPRIGEFYHMASRDSAAPPGRLRLLLRDREEVCRVHVALHEQTVQVSSDHVAIEVVDDDWNVALLSGNARGGRV